MGANLQNTLDRMLPAMADALGENLCSCCLYGSAVRGNFVEGVSDLNLLIILNRSTPQAHQSLAEIFSGQTKVDPFILSRGGLARSARVFAPKFQSIRRNYRVLLGEDLLAQLEPDPELARLLCEQSIRNLRLRLVYAFVKRDRLKTYERFLCRIATGLVVQVSEILRFGGASVPQPFAARLGLMEAEFGPEAAVIADLLELKNNPRRFSEEEAMHWHGRLFPFVDKVVGWIESRWPV